MFLATALMIASSYGCIPDGTLHRRTSASAGGTNNMLGSPGESAETAGTIGVVLLRSYGGSQSSNATPRSSGAGSGATDTMATSTGSVVSTMTIASEHGGNTGTSNPDTLPGAGGAPIGTSTPIPSMSCSPTCLEPTPVCSKGKCVACENGMGRCVNNAPQLCDNGEWVSQPACNKTSPVCSNGICASERVKGGFVTISSSGKGTVRLRNQRFESFPRLCSEGAANRICVVGGIRP